jgi:hypothetical protein
MTTPTDFSPTTPGPRSPLRLRLDPALGDGAVDGAWWPQSRDLALELADLVDHFPVEHGRVQRAVFSRPDWDTAPHRVSVARGLIKVGSYPDDDSHQIWLSMSTHAMIRLTVTSFDGAGPQEEPSAWASTADADGTTFWTDDGGSWWDPHPTAPSERA